MKSNLILKKNKSLHMKEQSVQLEKFSYDNKIVRNFAVATIIWGIVGMLVGVIVATQLFEPAANVTQYGSFGRIRPLHTNAVIFAFVGNAIFAGAYYSMQRLLKARMFSDFLSKFHFWGWQTVIVLAAVTLPLGITTSHEYAELEWPIDILITLVWVAFGINMFGTIVKRRERHLYVAIWFYIATFITVAVLHLVNSVQLPIGFLKSYYVYSGVQDALVQWWYGHNAVAFFLTTPYLGMMYYFLPKMANRPVYSYRLSILHFWALIFIYIWAGPHHLLYSTLPDWAQSLGVVFSIMLIAPSWGGMINGLLTLRGAWDKVRENNILKFMVVAITAYGLATFEGPMLSLKNINAIAHFTDWVVAHVHVGALGWNGFMTFAILYWLVPRIFNTTLFSEKLVKTHFWIGTIGIAFYAIPMYISGFTQGMMWKQFTAEGTLQYGNFLDTTLQLIPMHQMRALGGTLYLVGAIIMAYNLFKTMAQGSLIADEEVEAAPLLKVTDESEFKGLHWHSWLERKPFQLLVFSLIAILIGSLVELIPTFMVKSNVPTISSVQPYTSLELEGRDIYIREGCVSCHSQLVRPFRSETERYGEFSKSGEYVYDHPFLWGSKRTGPDLQREGGKYPHSWHYHHMMDPTSMSPGSIMPSYPWLFDQTLNTDKTQDKLSAMKTLGVPYDAYQIKNAVNDLKAQAKDIQTKLAEEKIKVSDDKEIIALIAYLQRIGTDIKKDQ
ncbi:cytochrome-c oxidase, cbb3-type subunit I [Sandaracinomonas limnophila]|uniref:cytochrome-c oxidase n=2 Tax=Sandaracinomonas limnophila TaxID=1862386 RepID=A0A437PWE8_9BACT|nr:cytochrome-c oxidase, cbb3-type subunit I [Sandaracinomonas limnophila]